MLSGFCRAVRLLALMPIFACAARAQSPGIGGVAVQIPPQATSAYLFSGTGLNLPPLASSAASYQVARLTKKLVCTPDYVTWNHKFFVPAFYLSSTSPQEQYTAAGVITVAGMKIVLPGGQTYALTVNGSTTWTITPGASNPGVWTDVLAVSLPADTCFQVWTYDEPAQSVTNGMLGIYTPDPHKGEVVYYSGSQSPIATLYAGGSASATAYYNIYAGYGPAAMVSQGGDGRPVALAFGDSIGRGQGAAEDFSDPRGNVSVVQRMLDSNYNGARRIPYGLWACGGLSAGQTTTAANFALRFAMIAALPNVPFNYIVNELGTNDNNATLTTWETALYTEIGLLKTQYPGIPLVQLGWPPRVTYSTGAGTTQADQTITSNYGSGSNSDLIKIAMATKALNSGALTSNPDLFFDMQPYFSGLAGSSAGLGTTYGKWRLDPGGVTPYTSTLAAASSAGASSISLTAAPTRGAVLAIDPANGSLGETASIDDCTGVGPYTCTIKKAGWGGTLTNAHASGATVTEISSVEGLHPSTTADIFMAQQMAAPLRSMMGTY